MSKAPDPRPRYIALRIHGSRPVSRRAFGNTLTGHARKAGLVDDALPRLTRYAYPHAIVRTLHQHDHATRAMLPKITWAIEGDAKVPLKVETLLASGTIKTLTSRLHILEERGPKEAPQTRPQKGTPSGKPRATTGGQGKPQGTGSRNTKRSSTAPNKLPGALRGGGPAPPPGKGR